MVDDLILFFGDSMTEGENSEVNFTELLNNKYIVKNVAVSGTTIGEYSIYPVDGNSLVSLIKKHEGLIKICDTIYLEYGINDVSSIMCGFTSARQVLVSYVKVIDAIKQLNPDVIIKFIIVSNDKDTVRSFAYKMCDYLNNIYFKGFDITIDPELWAKKYIELVNTGFSNKCDVVEMFSCSDEYETTLSSDNVHPDEVGHRIIASNLGML